MIEASGWRLPDDACALLERLVREHEPELIVECGSGRSTLVLARAAGAYGGHVVSLEHDPIYVTETNKLLEPFPAREFADVRYAPLEEHGGSMPPRWYARHAWEDLHGIGMLLVDGPPGGSARWARSPAVPLLRDQMLPGCLVVLDDAQRDDERQAIAAWGIEMTLVKHAKATIGYGTIT